MIPRPQAGETHDSRRWKHGAVPVVGLIGGIGSGKSVTADLLAGRGAVVIDADAVGHELLNDPHVLNQIVERFGPGVLASASPGEEAARRVDRRALGAIVFADPTELRALEAILHPRMRARFVEAIAREQRVGGPIAVVLDAAILLEAGWDDLCDLVVFVDAPRHERRRRVARARRWSEETFEVRERAQWPCDEKRRRADLVLTNNDGVDLLRDEVARLDLALRGPAHSDGGRAHGQLGVASSGPPQPIENEKVFDLANVARRMP